jgi:adenylate cyclase
MSEPPTILIVDDEPFNVDLLEQQLEELGYRTISAANGKEAVERALAEAPDLILLDVMMPVMDGFAACRVLKEQEQTRLIPVVIMTALGAVEDRVRGIEAGADDFLTKPVDDRELLARVRTAIRQRQAVAAEIGALSRTRDHFAKFVPSPVRRELEADPGADMAKRARDVSVMFLDISGYTRLAERLAPDDLNRLVESYFSAFLDRVNEAGGDITETAGDGFMAVYAEVDAVPDHAVRAADSALALLAATEALNRASAGEALAVRIGINSGVALVGPTRLEGARESRWTFTASGPVTNLAARLAELAEPWHVLVGPETARRLGSGFHLEGRGPRTLKNVSEPVVVHRVLGRAAG